MPTRRRSNPTTVDQPIPHQKSRTLASLTAATLALGLLLAPNVSAAPAPASSAPLLAEPATPGTSEEAQQAYLKSTERAEALNEQTLVAGEKEQAAKTLARATAKTLADKNAAAALARAQSTAAATAKTLADRQHRQAAATAAGYQDKVDAFAGASFRGARLGSMSALLIADSPEDFLDAAATLNMVAADSQQTLAAAAAAKETARTAREQAARTASAAQNASRQAGTAAQDAQRAKTSADAARAATHAATQDLTRRQQDLRAEATRLAELRDRLTEQEREAALRAAAEGRQRAAEQAAAQASAQEAQAAQQAAGARANRANRAATPPAAAPTEQAPSVTSQAPATTSSNAPAPAASGAAEQAVQAALSKVGSRYVWGAAGPDSFDCSGLTSWAYAQAGITIPRTSGGQNGLPTVPMDQLQPGDLITYYSPVSHVAMYIGNGQIVHASTASKPVYVSSVYYGGPNATAHRVTG